MKSPGNMKIWDLSEHYQDLVIALPIPCYQSVRHLIQVSDSVEHSECRLCTPVLRTYIIANRERLAALAGLNNG